MEYISPVALNNSLALVPHLHVSPVGLPLSEAAWDCTPGYHSSPEPTHDDHGGNRLACSSPEQQSFPKPPPISTAQRVTRGQLLKATGADTSYQQRTKGANKKASRLASKPSRQK
ncbi:hypothetical protein CDL12_19842 [Handroanthus impetiginosus]|uniref:Uncharacterized protein n=1 Tax=Handroanthus impetiginosus TaxID=429701 RepID=A0A2G9GQM9_9LAMI|nr:hypothetical protein CDL12_19842 [Handroanthus impetiginosus]